MEFPNPLIGPTYSDTLLDAKYQRCVNRLPKEGALIPRPGMARKYTVGNGPIRGMWVALGNLYALSGPDLYEITTGGVATNLGTINTTNVRVSFSDDGTNLILVDGTDGWYYAGILTKITDADFTGTITAPKFVAFSNGFFLVTQNGTARFYKSQTKYDASAWAGEFATAEYHPDDLAAIITQNADVWLIGDRTLEVWYYSGADFPWDPNPNSFQDYGTVAPYSVTRFDNGLAWLAQSKEISRVAVRTTGLQVQRISNTVIEREWATYSDVSDCFTWSMKMPGVGHLLVFQFPTADKTWVYDAEEQQWHEWERYHENIEMRGRFRGNCYAMFNDMHLVGDYENGNIYEMKESYYTDADEYILKDRMGPRIFHERDRIFHHGLEVVMETGVGVTSTSSGVISSDPQIYLRYSDDRGKTWSNMKSGSFGKIGKYKTRVRFTRLGDARDRIYRLTDSEQVTARLVNAVVDAEPGQH